MKRAFDIVVALTGLVGMAPLMLAVALAIKLTSPGPVLFSQVRVGRHGRPFRIYKFRSMVVNAAQLGSSVTTGHDRRITPIGRVLRRTKLDEIPQLWNVLVGEMSLVGPRPDVPEIVANYTPAMRRILDARPGITSLASLHLRNEEDLLAAASDPDDAYQRVVVPLKVQLAMAHVDHQSLWFDLQVITQTLWALTGGRWWPLPAHPIVNEIRREISRLNRHPAEPAGELVEALSA